MVQTELEMDQMNAQLTDRLNVYNVSSVSTVPFLTWQDYVQSFGPSADTMEVKCIKCNRPATYESIPEDTWVEFITKSDTEIELVSTKGERAIFKKEDNPKNPHEVIWMAADGTRLIQHREIIANLQYETKEWETTYLDRTVKFPSYAMNLSTSYIVRHVLRVCGIHRDELDKIKPYLGRDVPEQASLCLVSGCPNKATWTNMPLRLFYPVVMSKQSTFWGWIAEDKRRVDYHWQCSSNQIDNHHVACPNEVKWMNQDGTVMYCQVHHDRLMENQNKGRYCSVHKQQVIQQRAPLKWKEIPSLKPPPLSLPDPIEITLEQFVLQPNAYILVEKAPRIFLNSVMQEWAQKWNDTRDVLRSQREEYERVHEWKDRLVSTVACVFLLLRRIAQDLRRVTDDQVRFVYQLVNLDPSDTLRVNPDSRLSRSFHLNEELNIIATPTPQPVTGWKVWPLVCACIEQLAGQVENRRRVLYFLSSMLPEQSIVVEKVVKKHGETTTAGLSQVELRQQHQIWRRKMKPKLAQKLGLDPNDRREWYKQAMQGLDEDEDIDEDQDEDIDEDQDEDEEDQDQDIFEKDEDEDIFDKDEDQDEEEENDQDIFDADQYQ